MHCLNARQVGDGTSRRESTCEIGERLLLLLLLLVLKVSERHMCCLRIQKRIAPPDITRTRSRAVDRHRSPPNGIPVAYPLFITNSNMTEDASNPRSDELKRKHGAPSSPRLPHRLGLA